MLLLRIASPIPKFEGITVTAAPRSPAGANAPIAPLQPQGSGSARVPQLTPNKIQQYSSLFEQSGAQDGILPGTFAAIGIIRYRRLII